MLIQWLLYASLDPPEMHTGQLLLVSTLGLAVNLFGMFAMGGHHHHVIFYLTDCMPVAEIFSGTFPFPWTFSYIE